MDRLAPEYLETADEAGLLREFEGLQFVAGRWVDSVSGEPEYFVEYCDTAILDDPQRAERFRMLLVRDSQEACHLIIRTPAGVRMSAPWQPSTTYVRYAGGFTSTEDRDSTTEVAPASPVHDDLIEGWLVQAISGGYADKRRPVRPLSVTAAARQILSCPGRVSYVATAGGAAVGHVTLIAGARDDVTGITYVDLVDLLVDAGDGRRKVAASLVRAAARHAISLALPLIGNVSHPAPEVDWHQGRNVLESLARTGWRTDHVLWRCRTRAR